MYIEDESGGLISRVGRGFESHCPDRSYTKGATDRSPRRQLSPSHLDDGEDYGSTARKAVRS